MTAPTWEDTQADCKSAFVALRRAGCPRPNEDLQDLLDAWTWAFLLTRPGSVEAAAKSWASRPAERRLRVHPLGSDRGWPWPATLAHFDPMGAGSRPAPDSPTWAWWPPAGAHRIDARAWCFFREVHIQRDRPDPDIGTGLDFERDAAAVVWKLYRLGLDWPRPPRDVWDGPKTARAIPGLESVVKDIPKRAFGWSRA